MAKIHADRSPPRAWWCVAWLGALAFVLVPAAVAAQGNIGGAVISAETQQPLAGASVLVAGTNLGTLTNEDGRFLLMNVPGDRVRLRVTMLGHRTTTVEAAVGTTNLRITLEESAIELDRIVVTGTVGRQTKRALGNTVATLDAEQVMEIAPVQTLSELLNGRSPGVAIIHTTGMLGGGNRVRIRGTSSFSLSNEPLVYIDGVRVNNSQATGPVNQAFGSRSMSRWNDINPEDIESIEIIKGPAAATLYGTEASNGVIQIITKKGRAGQTRFTASIKQGALWWNPEDKLWVNYFDVGGDGTVETIDIVDLENQRLEEGCTRGPNDPITKCPVRPIWRTGHTQQYDLSASGGGDVIRYYISGGFENSTGVDYDNYRKFYTSRANITATPSDKLDINANMGYVTGHTQIPWEAGGGGATWTTFFARPDRLGTVRRGFWSYTPEMYEEWLDSWQDVNRTTLSFTVNHRPLSWLSHKFSIGRDYTTEEDVELLYHDERWLELSSYAGIGWKQMWDRTITYTTADYATTVDYLLTPDIQSSTSVGGQMYRRDYEFSYVEGENFPVPGLSSISATTQNRVASEYQEENVTVGAFIQEQIAWKDRLFVTAALRGDDNSAFGQDFDFVTYPKASVAWVISEEPFWNLGPVTTLKLRTAYGQSGQQPDVFVALRTFDAVPGVGSVTPSNIGNPELGPERGSEFEIGFDAGLFDDRLGVEFTYYNQSTKDAILLREIAPSSGFSGSQFVNAGEISNSGMELLVRGEPWQTDRHSVAMQFHIGTNSNEVVSLGDVTDEPFISAGSYNRHQVGHPVGAWFGKKIMSAELDANGRAINVMCDNGSGGSVACADAPEVYLGRVTPKFEGGFSTTVTLFDRIRLFGQMDFKTGFSKLDGNYRVRCWFFAQCEENWFPERFDPVTIAGVQQGLVDVLIDEADFLKLRELSLTYDVPQRWTNMFSADHLSVTLAGRNLGTWTKFMGLEPESTFNSGSRGGSELWEQNVLPQLTQFVATVNVGF